MLEKFSKALEKVTWKHWLVFLIMSQGIYAIMLLYTIPYLQGEAGGLKIFDMSPLGYNYATAQLFLTQLSMQGYQFYKTVQLPLDIFFPILNSIFAICTFVLLKRVYDGVKPEKMSLSQAVLISIPIGSFVFDYLENIMILIMLTYKTAVPRAVVTIANIFTICKSMLTSFFYFVIIIICILICIHWLNKLVKRVRNYGKLQFKRKEKSSA